MTQLSRLIFLVLATLIGCGGDTPLGMTTDAATDAASDTAIPDAGTDATADTGDDASTCVPLTCESEGHECGTAPDGCGAATVDCGMCSGGETCGGGGESNICGAGECDPTTCELAGATCGAISDGCDATLDCGGCSSGTCGGGGVPNECGSGCTPTSCAAEGATCGSIADGCGIALDCGACDPTGVTTCGGGGVPNECGCTPTTCAAGACGSISDGCGVVLDCGGCLVGTCGGGGVPNECGSCTIVDVDGDGHGALTCGLDCNDDESDVNPDQTAFFTSSIGGDPGGGYDYDCNGTEELEFATLRSGCMPQAGGACTALVEEWSPIGIGPPPCGTSSTYAFGCRQVGLECIIITETRTQACR